MRFSLAFLCAFQILFCHNVALANSHEPTTFEINFQKAHTYSYEKLAPFCFLAKAPNTDPLPLHPDEIYNLISAGEILTGMNDPAHPGFILREFLFTKSVGQNRGDSTLIMLWLWVGKPKIQLLSLEDILKKSQLIPS